MNKRTSIGAAIAAVLLAATAGPAFAETQKASPKMYFALEDLDRGPFMVEQGTLRIDINAGETGVGFTINDQWSNWWRMGMSIPEGQCLAPGFTQKQSAVTAGLPV